MSGKVRETVETRLRRLFRVDTSGCWLWTGSVNPKNGYGRFYVRGRYVPAHRGSFEVFKGAIPDGLQIDHLCRVRSCVNPAHLEAVTARVNSHRGVSFCAQNAAKVACKNGHEFTPENTYVTRRGRRNCRKCKVIAQVKYERRHQRAIEGLELEQAS